MKAVTYFLLVAAATALDVDNQLDVSALHKRLAIVEEKLDEVLTLLKGAEGPPSETSVMETRANGAIVADFKEVARHRKTQKNVHLKSAITGEDSPKCLQCSKDAAADCKDVSDGAKALVAAIDISTGGHSALMASVKALGLEVSDMDHLEECAMSTCYGPVGEKPCGPEPTSSLASDVPVRQLLAERSTAMGGLVTETDVERSCSTKGCRSSGKNKCCYSSACYYTDGECNAGSCC